MIIDFHSHSNASDGALDPIDLLQRARRQGISHFAITDHDTVAGYLQARDYYRDSDCEMRLISGVELSCQWSGAGIHVVGLNMNVEHPALVAGLQTLQEARRLRSEKIAERLQRLGFEGALDGARAEAGDSLLGRPHFARWMVKSGMVRDMNQAFDKYLGQGKPGDVKAYWPPLASVCDWIVSSGGVAVLAHPLKYRFTRSKLRRLVTAFRDSGGSAVEVLSGRQTSEQVANLKALAREFELHMSAGSDFHKEAEYGADLGVDITRLGAADGVWQQLA